MLSTPKFDVTKRLPSIVKPGNEFVKVSIDGGQPEEIKSIKDLKRVTQQSKSTTTAVTDVQSGTHVKSEFLIFNVFDFNEILLFNGAKLCDLGKFHKQKI